MAAGNGVVLTTNNVQVLSAFDTGNGDRLWSRELTRLRSAPTIVGDEVLAVTRMGEVQVYGLHDGQLVDQWRLPLPADDADWFVDADPALVGDVLVLSAFGGGDLTDTALFAYPVRPDLPSGPQLHITARPIPGIPTEPPALVGEDVVLAIPDGLYTVDPGGAATRLMSSGDAFQTGAAVADGIAVAPHGQTVQARRLEDGTLLWKSPAADPVFGAVPAIAGDTVFYPIKDQGLVAVDLYSGDPLWVQAIADQQFSVAPLTLPNGDVLYGGGGLARFDGATGEVQWRDPAAHLFAAPAYAEGSVFAVGADPAGGAGELGARDAATGQLLWSHPVADPQLYLAPAVADGVVVSFDGSTAHAYDAETGEERWTLAMHRAAAGAPFVSDGHVFLSESGNGRDLDDQSYRVSVHDLHTGRFLGAWEPDATPLPPTPDIGGTPDGRLMIPTALGQLAFLEAR
jgi:outer membrane protein assembly factor BamB